MNIVILGCGRVGSTFARQLTSGGHSVAIIDLTSEAFRRLGTKFKGEKVVGTGMDQDTLKRAGIEKADAFIAVTQGDNTNIMAAQIADRVFKVAKVYARIYDPIRADAYREIGVRTLCTTTMAAGVLRGLVTEDEKLVALGTALEGLDREYREQVV